VPRPKAVPPRNGTFKPDSERLAHAEVDGDSVTIRNVRDSEFPEIDVMNVRWIDETYDAQEITNVWVYFGYFGAIAGVAHTEIAFEFSDYRCVVASFEIRPLVGQRYSIKAGLGRNFEMCLRWTTERDAMLRRFNRTKPDTRMHRFEAAITHTRSVELFHAAAQKTNDLHDNPEWYNAATNSCSISLVRLVNEVLPRELRSTPRVILPGLLPKFWARQGVLKLTNGTLDDTMASSVVDEQVMEIGYVPDFSAQFHGRV